MPKRRPSKHQRIERPLSMDATHWRADGMAKTRYENRQEGLAAAGFRYQESKVSLSVYQCAFCGGWHLGRDQGRGD